MTVDDIIRSLPDGADLDLDALLAMLDEGASR